MSRINFGSKIAYYPCDFLDGSCDYNTPGDDCVRYMFAIFNTMDSQFTQKYAALSKTDCRHTNSSAIATDDGDIAFSFINLGFKIYDISDQKIDINKDNLPEGYIFKIDDDFQLKKGDLIAKEGHVHIYLGNGSAVEAKNFGWGRVYRSYPQIYKIQPEYHDGARYISLTNNSGTPDYYRRVYRYVGQTGGATK